MKNKIKKPSFEGMFVPRDGNSSYSRMDEIGENNLYNKRPNPELNFIM